MSARLSKNKIFRLLSLLFLGGSLSLLPASAAPLPLPSGPINTNLFNTNGLVIPPDVRFLLRDLRSNLDQVDPFLAIINGETNRTNLFIVTNFSPFVFNAPNRANPDEINGLPLIFALGAALENVQTDLDELLPRLAAMAGLANTNFVTNSVSTNSTPNNFIPVQTNGIAVLMAPFFAQPTNPPIAPQPSVTTPLR